MAGVDYRKSEKGMTLLEALVSTAIIGIGFVAIFQMVQYSVRSIDVSGERTKANLFNRNGCRRFNLRKVLKFTND